MKRIYLVLLMIIAALGMQSAMAQDVTVTIPEDGTFSSSSYFPLYNRYRYSISEQIYTASEIGMGGKITSIAFNNVSSTTDTRTVEIYMFSTQENTLTSNGILLEEWCFPRYSGIVNFAANDWTTIEFDVPFEYDGVSNLCLVVDDNTGDYPYNSLYFQTYSAGSIYQSAHNYSDSKNYDPYVDESYTPSSTKNRVQFTIAPNPYPSPIQLHVDGCTEAGATLSWTAPSENVTGYIMQYMDGDNNGWETVTGNITSPITISGLTPHNKCEVRLKALYGENESDWANVIFTYEVSYQIEVDDAIADYITIAEEAIDGTSVNVTLNYTRDYTYETYTGLGTVTITPETGDPITITPTHSTVNYYVVLQTSLNYIFTMPASNVTVTADVITYYNIVFFDIVGEYPRSDNYSNEFNRTKTIRPAQSTLNLSPNSNSGKTFMEYQIFSKDMVTGDMTNITSSALNENVLTTPASYCYVASHYYENESLYTLTVDDEGEYLSGIADASVNEGAKVTYAVEDLPENYIIIISTEYRRIMPIYDALTQTYYFYMPDADVTISAHPVQTYNITYRETDYSSNILFEYTSTANEFDEVEVPFESHDIYDYSGCFYVYSLYLNELFDNYCETSSFTMPADDVIVEGRFSFNSPVIMLSVNGNLISTIEVEPEDEIELPTPVDSIIPEGFCFLGWTDNERYFYSPYSQPYSLYNDSYYLESDDAITLYAVFYQPGDVDCVFPYNYDYYPADQDTIVIAGEIGDEYSPIFYGLTGAGNDVLLDYYWVNEYDLIISDWIDGDDVHHNANTIAWSVEQISDDPYYFALKQGEQYLNIINGEIALGNDYTYGIFDFEKVDWRYSIMEVNSESYLAITEDHLFTVENSSENSLFDIFKQQKAGKNFTTEVHYYGDGEFISYLFGVNYITGHVSSYANWLSNEGLVVIKNNGFLDVRECYFSNNEIDQLIIEDGGQLFCYSEGLQGTMLKNISGYDEQDDNWHLISLPLYSWDGYPIDDLITDNYDLFGYDETIGYWTNSKDEDSYFDILNQFSGYLYATQDDITLEFQGELMTPLYSSYAYVTRSTETAGRVAGFNLLGNPFTYDLNVSDLSVGQPLGEYDDYVFSPIQTIYVIEGSRIIAAQNEDATVKPCEGFFVRTGVDDELVLFSPIEEEERATIADIKIEITGNERGAKLIDRAYINFSDAQNMEKFQLDNQTTRLYIPQGDKDYAAVSTNNEGSSPLNFVTSKDGEYTLTINTDNLDAEYIHLIDHLTGADVNLLTNKSYSFSAKTSDDASRFSILFKAKPVTSFSKTSSK